MGGKVPGEELKGNCRNNNPRSGVLLKENWNEGDREVDQGDESKGMSDCFSKRLKGMGTS